MDKDYMWEIEGIIRNFFDFKKDDGIYTYVSKHGYDQHYLDNRELLKKSDTMKLIEYFKKSHPELCVYYPTISEISKDWNEETDLDSIISNLKNHYASLESREDLRRIYVVLGFLYLQYQLDIPHEIKEKIINSADCEILYSYEKENPLYEKSLNAVKLFKHAIQISDGEGVKIIGITLPKRTIIS